MAELRRRMLAATRWALTLLIVVYAISDWGGDADDLPTGPSDEPGVAQSLRITAISDANVNPGDAVVVSFEGAEGSTPVDAKLAKRAAEVLVRERTSIVVRIPNDLPIGKAALRLYQGERKSKAWDLHIKATNHRKLIGRLVGGLALFVFGLGLLASGVRGFAGQGIRALLGRLTRSPAKAVGVGVLVGSVTQLTSSAAALTVSLVDARLVALGPTIAIFVGAQLGASITGALLPVGLARESLLVIAIGVLWTRLSTGRRAHAVAQLVLGAGLMLYGLHLLQTSVEPLVSDPKILPYVDYLRTDGALALLSCAGIGAVLAFTLQGPGPVYVLVVGLGQASGVLPLTNALAILAGTNLGAAIGMALIAWQSGRSTRSLVVPHLLFGTAATALVLASLPLWTRLADSIVGGDQAVLDYGHNVMRPGMSTRLAIGFAISEMAVTLVWLTVLPSLMKRAILRPKSTGPSPSLSTDALVLGSQRELVEILDRQRLAIEIALETSCTCDRARAPEAEEVLAASRGASELGYAQLVQASPPTPELRRVTRTVVAVLQLQRVVEQLLHLAELGVERGVRLSPEERDRLTAMHRLARAAFDAVIDALERNGPVDLEAAGDREIRMNLLEAEGRSASLEARTRESSSLRLGIAELVDSYEHVGNHLFRVTKTMMDDPDEL